MIEGGQDWNYGALSTGAGYGVTELTGNQELGMAAGVLSSFAFGKGLDDIDESLNISGLSRPKGLPKTANCVDDIDLSKPAANRYINAKTIDQKSPFDNANSNPNKIKEYTVNINNNGNKLDYNIDTKPIMIDDVDFRNNYDKISRVEDIINHNFHIN